MKFNFKFAECTNFNCDATYHMDTSEFDHLFQIKMMGDRRVGKTCIIKRYCNGIFSEDQEQKQLYPDYKNRSINVNQKIVKLQIWDFEDGMLDRISCSFFRDSHAIIIVFDLTNLSSFKNVKYWFEDPNISERIKILVGCKCELVEEIVVDYATVTNLAENFGVKYFECSSKFSINVDDIFSTIALDIMENITKTETENSYQPKQQKKERGCSRNIQ